MSHKDNRAYVEKYFNSHEKASVNDCVRDGLASGVHLTPGMVSAYRRTMKARVEAKPVITDKVTMKKQWNTPQVVTRPVLVPPLPAELEQAFVSTRESMTAETEKEPSYKEKVRVLSLKKHAMVDDLLLNNPTITAHEIQRRLREKFGQGTDVIYVNNAIKMIRDLGGRSGKKTVASTKKDETSKMEALQKQVAELIAENNELKAYQSRMDLFLKNAFIEEAFLITAARPGSSELLATTKGSVKQELLKLANRFPSENIKVWTGKSPEWDVKF